MLVVGENWEEQLAPYNSQLEVAPYIAEDGEESRWNPNGQWDWYVIGGRYAEIFLLKEGATGYRNPKTTWARGDDPVDSNRFDQARKGDIDWERMLRDQRESLEKEWYEYGERYSQKEDENMLNYAREYTTTAEEYVVKHTGFVVYGYVKDGMWRDRYTEGGDYDASEKEQNAIYRNWCKELRDMITALPDDTLLTIVDCHN